MYHFKKMAASLLALTALGGSLVSANAGTFVGDRTDFRDETIYFAMTTRFYDGDPMNNVCSWDKQDVQIAKNDPDWRGDFAGLIEKLDYIKALGFTAIWITPVVQNASGEDYHGYHAMDFKNVDLRYESRKEWGSAKDVKFKDLIEAAHAKDMKIILDIVLQHTGNFGETTLNPLFTRDQNIRNQASVSASLIPNTERLSSNYFDQEPKKQYEERWKYFKNPQYEPNNYYHHYGTGWNWDLPNRWWGQIAGDCVDLNTENDYVAQYIVKCYGEFIRMGVDGFRIDTTGHIAPLTFNKQFIPQFLAIAEECKDKRKNGADFFMFGECCQRFQGSVVYRDQPNLSSYFYTWKSDQSLLNEYNGDPAWWVQQTLPEGHDTPVGPMAVCDKDTKDKPTSNNALMLKGAWHAPDYSQYSGFSVIDFPMHYAFNNAASAVSIARSGDNKYNDATYNVVYVDSHDYCPGPNDGTRFNGGTEQWAENLSLMFTFRGIPCIYYGSEVEFKKGLPIDVGGENNKTPRSQSGRAYFGEYVKGDIKASDFGVFTATGNASKTLSGDLSRHIIRLNKIRAAVPALRKGQYTFDGCSASGGWAFKRAYKDSYALVAINGGGTFSNVPSGTYVDLVTGRSYTPSNGSISVSAPATKGQLRVLVKDWKGGKVGDDGKFIYASSPVAGGGSVTFEDPGTTQYYTANDAIGRAAVKFNPDGGTFRTETLTVTVSLNEVAKTGTYKVGNQSVVKINAGETKTFTIGNNMAYGESVTVAWTADDESGTVTYRKADPNAAITINVTGMNGANISGANMYAWNDAKTLTAGWPGNKLNKSKQIDGRTFYYETFDAETVNVIFNNGSSQTGDITGITADAYFEYDGGTQVKRIEVNEGPKAPVIRANPASGTTFSSPIDVTLSVTPATDIYYTLDGKEASAASTRYTAPIHLTKTTTINVYARNTVGETRSKFVYTYSDAPIVDDTNYYAFFDNAGTNWPSVYVYCWDDKHKEGNSFTGAWPGKKLSGRQEHQGRDLFIFSFRTEEPLANCKIIFNNGSGGNGNQTGDFEFKHNGIYTVNGLDSEFATSAAPILTAAQQVSVINGALVIISDVETNVAIYGIDGTMLIRHITEGINIIDGLNKGLYIVNGTKVII